MRTYYPADWDSQLDRVTQILHDPSIRSHANGLDFATAIEELRIIACDTRPYSTHATDAWNSTIDDVRLSHSLIGPALQRTVSSEYDRLTRHLRNPSLGDVTSMTALRPQIARACIAIKRRLAEPRTTLVVWQDLWEAILRRDHHRKAGQLRDVFIAVLGLRGHALEKSRSVTSTIESVLADDYFGILGARIAVGDITEDAYDDLTAPEPPLAGLRLDDRLRLIERYLERPAEEPHTIVWLLYERATLSDFSQKLGQVQFYRADWAREFLDSGFSENLELLPAEVRNHRSQFRRFFG